MSWSIPLTLAERRTHHSTRKTPRTELVLPQRRREHTQLHMSRILYLQESSRKERGKSYRPSLISVICVGLLLSWHVGLRNRLGFVIMRGFNISEGQTRTQFTFGRQF